MIFSETPLKGSYVIALQPRTDERGFFMRTFCKNEFAAIHHTQEWVQSNHSYTKHKGSVRGMHYQTPPFSETKLVRCIAGSVLDVIVDIRKNSPTFLQHFSVELSAENKKAIYIPQGFAHGFQTLSNEVEMLYHHTQFYTPQHEAALLYNDPMLGIVWPLQAQHLSEKDTQHPLLTPTFVGI
ncbi:MAG: dTDP-4-dehydrorhamnose 3,5-epimerase [Bacteroidetes bacterium]|nr:dTDP-4-dehydrorhamnose 3,5-epimerase [Bacteroidota bacterium]